MNTANQTNLLSDAKLQLGQLTGPSLETYARTLSALVTPEQIALLSLAPSLVEALRGLLALNCIKVVENIHGEKATAIKVARALLSQLEGGR